MLCFAAASCCLSYTRCVVGVHPCSQSGWGEALHLSEFLSVSALCKQAGHPAHCGIGSFSIRVSSLCDLGHMLVYDIRQAYVVVCVCQQKFFVFAFVLWKGVAGGLAADSRHILALTLPCPLIVNSRGVICKVCLVLFYSRPPLCGRCVLCFPWPACWLYSVLVSGGVAACNTATHAACRAKLCCP